MAQILAQCLMVVVAIITWTALWSDCGKKHSLVCRQVIEAANLADAVAVAKGSLFSFTLPGKFWVYLMHFILRETAVQLFKI